jgi:anti-anti-sigma factor
MIRTVTENDIQVVCPEGNLDLDGTARLQEALEKALTSEGKLAVDLVQVQILSSSAIGALIAAHNALRPRGEKLIVRNASGDVGRLLKLMGLDRHFEIV